MKATPSTHKNNAKFLDSMGVNVTISRFGMIDIPNPFTDFERLANEPVLDTLKRLGAIRTNGHYVYTSGRHGPDYIDKDEIFQHPVETARIGWQFAKRHQLLDIDVVVGPAQGGITLSQWTAFFLTHFKGREVLGAYTEKDRSDNQILKRGYDKLVAEKKVLVVEDTTTTGSSVKKVINNIIQNKGIVVAASSMVNRRPDIVNSYSIGVPFTSLCLLPALDYDPKDCPLCKAEVPIVVAKGHGKTFLESKVL